METTAHRIVKTVTRDGTKTEASEELRHALRMTRLPAGVLWKECVCTCTDLEEMILGRLFLEERIETAEDVDSCRICEETGTAEVILKNSSQRGRKERENRICTWKEEWIFALAEAFSEDTELHGRTSCAHSCFLAKEGKILYVSEDIGRYNAADKVVGWALKNHVPMEESMLFTSGRVSSEMIRKAVRAGIPLIASNAAPTEEAVELAESAGVVLIGAAKQKKMKIFTEKTVDKWEHPA